MRASYSLTALAAAGVLLFGAVACGDDDSDASTSGDSSSGDSNADSGAGSGSEPIAITGPADGDQVDGSGFDVTFESDGPLDEPDTGEHHVHLFFDGSDEYELVYSDSFTVDSLDEGEHTIRAALANADHSLTGDEDEISVTVGSGGGTGSGGGSDTTTDDPYDY